jgi:hypothetical protein
MGTQSEDTEAKGMFRKLGLPGAVAAAGAAVGLLFTMKPKRLRETVSELSGNARHLVGDLTGRTAASYSTDGAGQVPTQKIPAHFETRRRERGKRREQRRQHATR